MMNRGNIVLKTYDSTHIPFVFKHKILHWFIVWGHFLIIITCQTEYRLLTQLRFSSGDRIKGVNNVVLENKNTSVGHNEYEYEYSNVNISLSKSEEVSDSIHC